MVKRPVDGESSSNVVAFPPLPRVPRPPAALADPRQAQARHVVSQLQSSANLPVSGPNFANGFSASAVDLGRLQDVLERGLRRFDLASVERRWPEVERWIHDVLRAWVQRRKVVRIERRERGVRIELTTQDDRGYYDYAFDVFPGRAAPRRPT
jgi:hypothetical protein